MQLQTTRPPLGCYFRTIDPSQKWPLELIFFSISSPRRPLCVVGRLGRKEKRALSVVFFFDYCYFYPAGASEEERGLAEMKISRTNLPRDDWYSCV